MSIGAFLVSVNSKDKPLYETQFIKNIKSEGYNAFNQRSLCDKRLNWVWVNIDTKEYYMPILGFKMTGTIGDHAITEEEFYTIYNIYKKYEGLDHLEFKN